MKLKIAVAALALAVGGVLPLLAHHSFAAEYDSTKQVTVKGAIQKLEWVNQQWIKMTPVEELARLTGTPPEFVKLMQERAKTLKDIPAAWAAYMADDLPRYDEKSVSKQLTAETRPVLTEGRDLIGRTFDQGVHAMEEAFRALAEQRGLGLGKVLQPLRVATTGSTVSPPLFETLVVLGKDKTLRRIDAALEKIK